MQTTTIRLEPAVRDNLKRFGMKGETYNDIVKRLMSQSALRDIHAEARDAYLHPERHTFYRMEDVDDA